jgi:hypothetical protein
MRGWSRQEISGRPVRRGTDMSKDLAARFCDETKIGAKF